MTLRAGVAVVLAAVLVAVAGGVPAAAQQAGNSTTTPTPAAGDDAPAEYLAEVADGVYVVDYRFSSDEVTVTWYIADDAELPVEVTYADVGEAVEGEPGVRQPVVRTDAIIRSGEVQSTYPATDGPAGQITQISVEGQPLVIEGEGTSNLSLISTLRPTPALIVGAAVGVLVAGIVAYRQRTEELEEPVRAREILRRL